MDEQLLDERHESFILVRNVRRLRCSLLDDDQGAEGC